MIARILALVAATVLIASCLSAPQTATVTRWNPETAENDAHRDIAAGVIRFAYVGGYVPVAVGVPDGHYTTLRRYGRLEVGPQGCIQDEYRSQRGQYAERYNRLMWSYVSKHR